MDKTKISIGDLVYVNKNQFHSFIRTKRIDLGFGVIIHIEKYDDCNFIYAVLIRDRIYRVFDYRIEKLQ